MTFQANYPGVCQECGEPFAENDWIKRHFDGYQHASCVDGRPDDTRDDACTKCFLIHAGECP